MQKCWYSNLQCISRITDGDFTILICCDLWPLPGHNGRRQAACSLCWDYQVVNGRHVGQDLNNGVTHIIILPLVLHTHTHTHTHTQKHTYTHPPIPLIHNHSLHAQSSCQQGCRCGECSLPVWWPLDNEGCTQIAATALSEHSIFNVRLCTKIPSHKNAPCWCVWSQWTTNIISQKSCFSW